LVDQLFSSSEKRLARALLLLARFGKKDKPEEVVPDISQETLAEIAPWISSQRLEVVSLKQPIDSALAHLDAGEREAISLASELQAILC
jgi:hypothetical protein